MPNAPSPRQKLGVHAVAALSGLIGAGSLVLFGAFLWTGGFGLLRLNAGSAASLIWDGLLCLIFFLQHSAMIRQSFRRRVSPTIPTHWYGVVYTVASSAALLLLVGCWQRTDIVLAAAVVQAQD